LNSMKCLTGLAALCLMAGMAGRADATTILYDYKTNLSLSSGSDVFGLVGALLDIKVDVSSTAHYITHGALPLVVMNNDATITISGSSIPSNNGTFALPQLAFYPTYAGLYTDPAGAAPSVTLPVGGTLNFSLKTNPTAQGSSEFIGQPVNILDFAPATSATQQFNESTGSAFYNQVNPTMTASSVTASVPEPASVSLVAISLGALGLLRRRQTR
jgi:hypothetical protein